MVDTHWCWSRLRSADHGVLAMLHPARGPDAIPVVFAAVAGHVYVPIDAVKRKGPGPLQRLQNLHHEPRCMLLVHHYESDWSQLWWVRARCIGRAIGTEEAPRACAALITRFPDYRDPSSIVGLLKLRPVELRGWTAS